MFGIGAATYVAVVCLVLRAIFRVRAEAPETHDGDRRSVFWVVMGGVVIPTFLLSWVFLITLRTLAAVGPSSAPAEPVIVVRGKQWWWEIRYPDPVPARVVTTANELHIPVGRRIRIELESDDVIHSFWLPELQGKTDLIPGQTTVTWIEADTAGVYRGQCAEFCGLQHARMGLIVVAESEEQFERWLEDQRQPARLAVGGSSVQGQNLFLTRCGICHNVKGTLAGGLSGPDLTHVASRLTLAAGTLRNDPATIRMWIGRPQDIKKGSKMPQVPMSPAELEAISTYVASLR